MTSFPRWLLALFVSSPQTVLAETFGAWSTGVIDDGEAMYALTLNDSENLLGQFCSAASKNCMWVLGLNTACKENDTYPVLVNSDAGSSHVSVLCNAQLEGGLYRYLFKDFDAITDVVKKGSRVGFAFPLQGDQIRVVRFDLGGANRAIAVLQSQLERTGKKTIPKPNGTKDEDL